MRKPKITLLDVSLAAQGLGLAPSISRKAVRVGNALLRHLNRNTGRCDPGIKTIISGTGMCRSSVIRGLNEICGGSSPLFERVVHGGTHGTNKYYPNLELMTSFVDDYDLITGIKKPTDKTEGFHKLKPDKCQHVEPSQSQPLTPKPVE